MKRWTLVIAAAILICGCATYPMTPPRKGHPDRPIVMATNLMVQVMLLSAGYLIHQDGTRDDPD